MFLISLQGAISHVASGCISAWRCNEKRFKQQVTCRNGARAAPSRGVSENGTEWKHARCDAPQEFPQWLFLLDVGRCLFGCDGRMVTEFIHEASRKQWGLDATILLSVILFHSIHCSYIVFHYYFYYTGTVFNNQLIREKMQIDYIYSYRFT